jgi:hypothetical protein
MLIYKNSLCTQDRQGGRQKEKEIKGKEKKNYVQPKHCSNSEQCKNKWVGCDNGEKSDSLKAVQINAEEHCTFMTLNTSVMKF